MIYTDLSDMEYRNLAISFFGIFTVVLGGVFSIIRAFAVERQTATAEQELITSNMTKAVEQLGSDKNIKKDGKEITVPNIEVRLGGLYGLERIAKDSERDHIQIMEILCAYIRNNALKNENAPKEKPREDVQSALTIIARRDQKRIQLEEKHDYHLNLEECYLVGAHLNRANLTRANLIKADISKANLTAADLSWAHLYDANLTGAFLNWAKLNGAKLMEANLRKANLNQADFSRKNYIKADLTKADLTGADLTRANLTAAYLMEANLTGAKLINLRQVNEIKLTDTTLTDTIFINDSLIKINVNGYKVNFEGSILWNVDLSENNNLTQQQVDNIKHADATVILPEHLSPPSHWDQEKMNQKDFIKKYQLPIADYLL